MFVGIIYQEITSVPRSWSQSGARGVYYEYLNTPIITLGPNNIPQHWFIFSTSFFFNSYFCKLVYELPIQIDI